MHCLVVSCLIACCGACQTYLTDYRKEIPLGCVSGFLLFRPWEPPRINATFLLYDEPNTDAPRRIFRWNENFNASQPLFRKTDNLKFMIHGYTESSAEPYLRNLKNIFLSKDPNAKVVLVDWSEAAHYNQSIYYPNRYVESASNALAVGRILACFIERIISTYDIPEETIHVLGHSLGAQVMGRAVAWLSENFGIRVGRGTAMDAASPLFSRHELDPDRKDVHFMLALHTAVTTAYYKVPRGALGVYRAFGDVNLYPNNGTIIQPACRENNSFFCSHVRGYIYFTKMVKGCNGNCDFQGFFCANEADAIRGTCSNGTAEVCHHIRTQEAMADQARRSISILTFQTDMDELYLRCNRDEDVEPYSVTVTTQGPQQVPINRGRRRPIN